MSNRFDEQGFLLRPAADVGEAPEAEATDVEAEEGAGEFVVTDGAEPAAEESVDIADEERAEVVKRYLRAGHGPEVWQIAALANLQTCLCSALAPADAASPLKLMPTLDVHHAPFREKHHTSPIQVTAAK